MAILDLRDMPHKNIYNMVRFLYTTDLILTDDSVGDILESSIRLDLQIIVDICIDYLQHYTLETALLYFNICQRCDVTMLAVEIWRYICQNFQVGVTLLYFVTSMTMS